MRHRNNAISRIAESELQPVNDAPSSSEHDDLIMQRKITVEQTKPGQILIAKGGGARIVVLGDVLHGAELLATGGGARIEILGDIYGNAKIAATGGSANVMIRGESSPGTKIGAAGGGAKVTYIGAQ